MRGAPRAERRRGGCGGGGAENGGGGGCGVNSRPLARAARPRRGEGAAELGLREEGAGGAPGAPPSAARSRSLEAALGPPAARPVSGSRGRAGAPSPLSPSRPVSLRAWLKPLKPPPALPSGAAASLQVSGAGTAERATPPPRPRPPCPRSPAACGARPGRQGDLLRSGPQPRPPRTRGGRCSAGLWRGAGPGRCPRPVAAPVGAGTTERRCQIKHLQSRAICLQISGIPLQDRISRAHKHRAGR